MNRSLFLFQGYWCATKTTRAEPGFTLVGSATRISFPSLGHGACLKQNRGEFCSRQPQHAETENGGVTQKLLSKSLPKMLFLSLAKGLVVNGCTARTPTKYPRICAMKESVRIIASELIGSAPWNHSMRKSISGKNGGKKGDIVR